MRSNFRNFALAVAILGCAALVSGSASATPTLVGTTTNPTGINGLVVDGTIYNVTFSLTTLNSFTAGTTLSVDAATALAAALESLSVVELDNTVATFYLLDVDNSLTDFDAAELCTLGCGAWAGSGGHTAPNLGFSGISLSTGVVEAACWGIRNASSQQEIGIANVSRGTLRTAAIVSPFLFSDRAIVEMQMSAFHPKRTFKRSIIPGAGDRLISAHGSQRLESLAIQVEGFDDLSDEDEGARQARLMVRS